MPSGATFSSYIAQTLAFARIGYDVAALVGGTVSPYLLNPTAANLKGKAAWIPCGINALLFVYGYFRIPETKNRNSEELDIMFGASSKSETNGNN